MSKELTAKVEVLEQLVATQATKIEALENAKTQTSLTVGDVAAADESPKTPTEAFDFEGKSYYFNYSGIRHDGRVILSKDALEDDELLKLFVKEYPASVRRA